MAGERSEGGRPLSDEEIAAVAHKLMQQRPDADWPNILSGRLLGPATPDRPDVPVWKYLDYETDQLDVSLGDLCAIRFPVRFVDGEEDVTSVDEQLRAFSKTAHVSIVKPFELTQAAIVRRYKMLFEAGFVRWDSAQRAVVYRRLVAESGAVMKAWADLERAVERE